MIENLVDRDTWFASCAMGSNEKPPLDSEIMKYVEKKVFEYHPLKATQETYKTAWKDCIISIDNRARDLKRRLKEKTNKK